MNHNSWRNRVYVAALIVLSSTACKDDTTSGAAGSGATAGSTATAGSGGAANSSAAKAVAKITGFMGGTVTGTATFVQSGSDVTVTVALSNCVDGKMYPAHIHVGTSCADVAAQGDHWGPARGEGIPKIACSGTTGTATLTRTAAVADLAWSVGGDATTNVVGHAFVVHDPDVATSPPRIGCGLIAKE
jgi:hypothetical protein